MLSNSFVEINLNNYAHNLNYLQNHSNKRLIAIIKANAYGTVDHIMAKYAKECGVNFFGVSSLDEAINLRTHDKTSEILILGYVPIEYIPLVIKYNLSISTVSKAYVLELLKNDISNLKVHLKIDTGMHRIGLFKNEVKEMLNKLLDKNALVEGIFTHYACSDSDLDFTQRQYDEFKELLTSLDYSFKYIHTSNTDATLKFNDTISTHVRCGLGILGYSSYESSLKPVVSLYTHINNTKLLEENQGISYGQKYHTSNPEYIATLTIGYADGLLRRNHDTNVCIAGKLYPIVGTICMDQLMVRVDSAYPFGTLVEIFGDKISLYDIAKSNDTIPYEILTTLSDRLDRVYIKDGNVKEVYNPRYNNIKE